MDNHFNFQTYLLINSKSLIISANDSSNSKKLYEKEKIYQNNSKGLDLNQIDLFLKENIFEIEKKLDDFVKDIILIIDFDFFLNLSISIKKNNNKKLIKSDDINYLLNDLKEQCKKSFQERKIIHMIIDNYRVNNQDYLYLPENVKCDFFSLDVTFICLSNEIINDLEKVFETYHVSITKMINASYMRGLFRENKQDLFLMAKKTIEGFNKNEVMFAPKFKKNKGFFEKFFHFFS